MPLPAPQPRTHLHTRAVTFRGYLRNDGLWDIEGEMSDVKTYTVELSEHGSMPPGTPVHGMAIRVAVDDTMTIREIASTMDHTPFSECKPATDPMHRMVGVCMAAGWRQAIERELGGINGCAHLRELLFNMATAAYQTVFPYQQHQRRLAGSFPHSDSQPPPHLGRCLAWNFDGPVVARVYPQFVGWKAKMRP